jgi:MIP family channel proteins
MNSKALLAEFIGTAALIFIGAGAGALGIGGLVGVALAHGLVIVSFAYAYGSISGAHLNPAVTLAAAIAGATTWKNAVAYWVVQLAGGAFGALLLSTVLGGAGSGLGATVPAEGVTVVQAILLEAILTFLLVNVILHSAVRQNSPHAGLAIGLTLVALILMGGPLTGASLNPARTFGPALLTGTLDVLWIYVLGTSVGAALAAFVYRALK